MPERVHLYNDIRPQQSLQGYTQSEAYEGTSLDHFSHIVGFKTQKFIKIAENKKNRCEICK